jgi:hypothetical protein
MGWPLAVSNGLMKRNGRALFEALVYLAFGHILAVLAMTLPFGMLLVLTAWQREVRMGSSVIVMTFGAILFIRRRHPRSIARIAPSRLALWSFAIAIAHGAGLMLIPLYLGLCQAVDPDSGHRAARALITSNLDTALLVAVVHTVAMLVGGGLLAWLVYRYLGLAFVSRSWFNLEMVWSSSLVLIGAASLFASIV